MAVTITEGNSLERFNE